MQTRPPFNVNSLAQAAAIASLADPDQVPRSQKCNRDGKNYFYEQLERRGLSYEPTQANFIFMDTARDARQAGEELLCRGVIIRVGDWIFNSPSHIRVTIGTPDQNRRFFEALDEVLNALPPLTAQASAAIR
jgi:histidinol-phosphate aminotransferase